MHCMVWSTVIDQTIDANYGTQFKGCDEARLSSLLVKRVLTYLPLVFPTVGERGAQMLPR
jgi:hypothetical protein